MWFLMQVPYFQGTTPLLWAAKFSCRTFIINCRVKNVELCWFSEGCKCVCTGKMKKYTCTVVIVLIKKLISWNVSITFNLQWHALMLERGDHTKHTLILKPKPGCL
jgi:hypothetical protein